MKNRRFEAVVDIWKNATAELAIIAGCEFSRRFRRCTNAVMNVCGSRGTVLKEIINKHISV